MPFTGALTTPYSNAVAVTPADDTDLAENCRGLFVGTAGTLTVVTLDDSTVQFGAVPNGTELRIRVTRVKSTGTSASNIVALY